MNRLKLAVVMLVMLIVLLTALPASAITDGEPDGNAHRARCAGRSPAQP
jgi:hypothetical protein